MEEALGFAGYLGARQGWDGAKADPNVFHSLHWEGNSGFLYDSPSAIWHLHGEKPGGMGLPAKTELILSSPSVPCLFPVP